jgi:hypothetical protein
MSRTHGILGSALVVALSITGCVAGQIEQPSVADLAVAPESERVDLARPSFSNPTEITNPLFPVSRQASVLLVGTVDDRAFRTEVTLLPTPRIIEWEGMAVETLVSQYVAFLDGRLHEVAYDFYAQADDGSVWYFGEDVFNFADGAIVDTHGSWIAGADGPAAMIMPADPRVGDVFRPENIPGLVFEEVTVREVGVTLDGPFGPIEGGFATEELHMDGSREEKSFAPWYGEFYTSDGSDTEALAMAVPTDALDEPVPEVLETMGSAAADALAAARAGDWATSAAATDALTDAWGRYDGPVPALLDPLVADAIAALSDAVTGRDANSAHQAVIDVGRLTLDVQLLYRPVPEVDLARFGLWASQLQLDAEEADDGAVNGDLFSLDYVRERIRQVLTADDGTRINALMEEIDGLVQDGDLAAVADAAEELRDVVAGAGAP